MPLSWNYRFSLDRGLINYWGKLVTGEGPPPIIRGWQHKCSFGLRGRGLHSALERVCLCVVAIVCVRGRWQHLPPYRSAAAMARRVCFHRIIRRGDHLYSAPLKNVESEKISQQHKGSETCE